MPIYEYVCPRCDYKFELLRPFSPSAKTAPCPHCQQIAERILSVFACFSVDERGLSSPVGGNSCASCEAASCDTCGIQWHSDFTRNVMQVAALEALLMPAVCFFINIDIAPTSRATFELPYQHIISSPSVIRRWTSFIKSKLPQVCLRCLNPRLLLKLILYQCWIQD